MRKLLFLLISILCLTTSLSFSQNYFYIVVASVENDETATKERNKYIGQGFNNTVVILSPDRIPYYRVCIESFATEKEAILERNRLVKEGVINSGSWITNNAIYAQKDQVTSFKKNQNNLISNKKNNQYSNFNDSEFQFANYFKDIADQLNYQFEYIKNYREGKLHELLYEISDISHYMIIVDLAAEKYKNEKISYSFYIISKSNPKKSKKNIEVEVKKTGSDIWQKLLTDKFENCYGLRKLDETSLKEYYWEEGDFSGIRYKFNIYQ